MFGRCSVLCYGVVTDNLVFLLTQRCSWYKPTVGFSFVNDTINAKRWWRLWSYYHTARSGIQVCFIEMVLARACRVDSRTMKLGTTCACVCFVIIASLHIWSVFYQLPQWWTNTKTSSFHCRLTSTVHWRSLNQICYWFIQTVVHITHLNITLGEIVNKYLSTSIRNTINWWLNFNRYVVVMTLSHNTIPVVIKSCAIFWPPNILNNNIIWFDFRVSPSGFGNVIFPSLCLFIKTIGRKLTLIKASLQTIPWNREHKLWGCHPLVQMKVSIVYLL